MNNSFNYSGFADMVFDSNDDFEPYGFADLNENMQKTYISAQTSEAGFYEREYFFDEWIDE